MACQNVTGANQNSGKINEDCPTFNMPKCHRSKPKFRKDKRGLPNFQPSKSFPISSKFSKIENFQKFYEKGGGGKKKKGAEKKKRKRISYWHLDTPPGAL